MGFRLHRDAPAPRPVGGFESILVFFLDDETTRGEVRSLDELHQGFDVDVVELFPPLEHVDESIDHFAEIVRRDGGCHTHRDTRRAVDQKIRQRGRQHLRLGQRVVKVGAEVNCLLVQIR